MKEDNVIQPNKTLEVISRLTESRCKAEILKDRSLILQDRLVRVLRPPNKGNSSENKERVGSLTPIAEDIQKTTDVMSEVVDIINDTLDRLEV